MSKKFKTEAEIKKNIDFESENLNYFIPEFKFRKHDYAAFIGTLKSPFD